MRSARFAVVLDVCCVLVFVVIGRASHTKGESLAGIASTSWPFLCGLAAGWVASRAWRRPLARRPRCRNWACLPVCGQRVNSVRREDFARAEEKARLVSALFT